MTNSFPRIVIDETQRRIVHVPRRSGRSAFVKYAGSFNTDGRWRPKRRRFAFIRSELAAILRGLGLTP